MPAPVRAALTGTYELLRCVPAANEAWIAVAEIVTVESPTNRMTPRVPALFDDVATAAPAAPTHSATNAAIPMRTRRGMRTVRGKDVTSEFDRRFSKPQGPHQPRPSHRHHFLCGS